MDTHKHTQQSDFTTIEDDDWVISADPVISDTGRLRLLKMAGVYYYNHFRHFQIQKRHIYNKR